MNIVLASSNNGKIREFQSYLTELDIQLIPQSQFSNMSEVAETGTTFVENAIIKARHATTITGLPAIADDSGLLVDTLHSEPGIRSARYAGDDATSAENIKKLLAKLKNVPDQQRGAHFYCVIVFLQNASDPMPIICQGKWTGMILLAARGQDGFGYDPVFFDQQQNKSAAELSLTEKNRLSHRGQALQSLTKQLAKLIL